MADNVGHMCLLLPWYGLPDKITPPVKSATILLLWKIVVKN